MLEDVLVGKKKVFCQARTMYINLNKKKRWIGYRLSFDWEKRLLKEKGFFTMKKNCSTEELIVRKGTVRFTVKQELFVRRKGELYGQGFGKKDSGFFSRKNMFIQREVDHREECLFQKVRLPLQWKKLDYKEECLLWWTRLSVKQELCACSKNKLVIYMDWVLASKIKSF